MDISVEPINLYSVRKVLTSKEISSYEKKQFIEKHKPQIKKILSEHTNITGKEFQGIMNQRPLQKFRVIKNSFTKRGDKILLALALGIEPNEVENSIGEFFDQYIEQNKKEIDTADSDRINKIKTYIYRHGKKEQVIKMLDYELTLAKDKLKLLYQTLDYNTGGVADFFIRPIHRLDNNTLINLYDVVDTHLDRMENNGSLTSVERDETSIWALKRIYQIQNNQKLIKDLKTYEELT